MVFFYPTSSLECSFMSAVAIDVESATKIFENGVTAVSNLSLKIESGDFVAILGPSGCGKSTLLRLISQLESLTSGQISTSNRESRIGYVFQEPHLLPWKTVFENIALPLRFEGSQPKKVNDKVGEALRLVGLLDFAQAYPNQLSGGMKMRVSLCRALVNDPKILLLDEPFAALDEFTRQKLDEDLRSLWAQMKMTVVFVTHSISEAAFLANRAIILSRRPAKLVADLKLNLPIGRKLNLKLTNEFLIEMRKLSEAFREA